MTVRKCVSLELLRPLERIAVTSGLLTLACLAFLACSVSGSSQQPFFFQFLGNFLQKLIQIHKSPHGLSTPFTLPSLRQTL